MQQVQDRASELVNDGSGMAKSWTCKRDFASRCTKYGADKTNTISIYERRQKITRTTDSAD